MTLEIRILDDNGKELMKSTTDTPWQPLQWKAPPNQPIVAIRDESNGAYLIYALTVQPTVTLQLGYRKQVNPSMVKIF
jgi:hypothetical protein